MASSKAIRWILSAQAPGPPRAAPNQPIFTGSMSSATASPPPSPGQANPKLVYVMRAVGEGVRNGDFHPCTRRPVASGARARRVRAHAARHDRDEGEDAAGRDER